MLRADETFIFVSSKYANFADVFSKNLATKLSEYIEITDYIIDLIESYQSPYGPIYSLGQVELETLITYIKINFAIGFIRPSKSLVGTPIFFVKKLNKSFWLFVDYKDLNDLTIKNEYLLPLIDEFLNQLDCAKCFI